MEVVIRMAPRRTGLVVLLGACLCGTSLAQSPGTNSSPDQTVHWAATLAAAGGVKQGDETTLELSGAIEDGWHVYALTEPAGGPTALRVTLDENEVAEVAGAASGTAPSKRHDRSFGLVTQFYTHAFTVRVPVQVKQQPAGRQSIPVSVRFQTCSDRECQPPTTIHLVVPIEVLPNA
jgi:Disulphide bond corrector protein DsbC